MFFEVLNLAIVDFSIGVLYFSFVNEGIIFPLSWNYFSWGKHEGTFSIEFISKTVTYVFVSIEKFEMSLDLDAILICSSTFQKSYLKTTPLE